MDKFINKFRYEYIYTSLQLTYINVYYYKNYDYKS